MNEINRLCMIVNDADLSSGRHTTSSGSFCLFRRAILDLISYFAHRELARLHRQLERHRDEWHILDLMEHRRG
jgi:hypothetical protein